MEDGEADTISAVIGAMTRESQTVAAHAKSTGLLKSQLRVLEGLPAAFRHAVVEYFRT